MDPCVRKPTTPSPVFAPRPSGVNPIEREVEKILEEKTNENGKRLVDETEKCKSPEKRLKDDHDEPEKCQSPEKRSKEDPFDVTLDLTTSGDEETMKTPIENNGAGTSNILRDLVHQIDIEQSDNNTSVNLHENKTLKKSFKSKEFVSLSSDSEKEDGDLYGKKPIVRRTKLIPHIRNDGRQQCKYIFKRGSNVGSRCPKLAKNDFCIIHSKESQDVSKRNHSEECQRKFAEIHRKLASMEEFIEKQRKTINEDRQRIAKTEHCVSALRKKLREYESLNQELHNKIEHILETNKPRPPKEQSSLKQIEYVKFKNLDKNLKYPLVEFTSQYIILFGENSTKFKIATPKSMEKPNQEEKWILSYKFGSGKWDWVKNIQH